MPSGTHRLSHTLRTRASVAKLAFIIAAALALLTPSRRAWAEAFEVGDTSWEGCSELLEIARAELGATRVVPLGVLNWDDVRPEDGVLVLHPLEPMDAEETTAFMKAGGRLAIIDDYGRGNDTLERWDIERTTVPSRPVAALRNNPALAIAEPVVDTVAGRSSGPHPAVANVQRLVTNHPTGLRHPKLPPVLRIRSIGEPDVVIALAGLIGKGRLFAMSDPSALINEMVRYPGNRAFVAGLTRYLVGEEATGGRTNGRLFIVANRFREEGAFGGARTFRKDIDTEFRSIAAALTEARDRGFPPWLDIAFAALALLAVGIWVARASARPYRGPLPRYARSVPLVAQGGVAGRFAMLAAPSSPRALLLMELKSALFEAMTARFRLEAEPSSEALVRLARKEGMLDEETTSALKLVLQHMQKVETGLVASRPEKVTRSMLAEAGNVVRAVLTACGADAGGLEHGANGPSPIQKPTPGESAA
jgi:hypothetical protein